MSQKFKKKFKKKSVQLRYELLKILIVRDKYTIVSDDDDDSSAAPLLQRELSFSDWLYGSDDAPVMDSHLK